jgi:hypothetical protein
VVLALVLLALLVLATPDESDVTNRLTAFRPAQPGA